MDIEIISVNELSCDPSNARKHPEKNLEAIKASLKKFGQQKPIVIGSDNVVIAGNGSLDAAKALGWTNIKCVRSELKGAEAIAYAIADNRTQDLSEFDDAVLGQHLEALEAEDWDLSDIGFDAKDLDVLENTSSKKHGDKDETGSVEMKPIFSYYGGKQRLVSKLLPLIPKHTVYVEPFAGGATLFFAKSWPRVTNKNNYREVLNDLNLDIYNLYKCFQDKEKAEKLIHRLEFTLYAREEYDLRKEKVEDEIEKAARFYCDVNMGFSNVVGSGWGTGVYTTNLAATWASKIERLKDYLDRMASVHIECIDAVECVKKWDSPQTFFYCDPPYVGTAQGHYSGYTDEHLKALVDTLDNCEGSFLLSSYDTDIINNKGWTKKEFKAYCTASGKGKVGKGRDKSKANEDTGDRERAEVVWMRGNSKPVRPEIQELYDSGAFDCFAGTML